MSAWTSIQQRADPGEDARLARAHRCQQRERYSAGLHAADAKRSGRIQSDRGSPNDRLRQGALFANVNLLPETDGVLRKGYFGFATGGGFRPSMAAALAGGAPPRSDAFYIDFGISLPTITHLSFADVLANRFDPKLVAGRNILIGATALELGDEFAVPVRGIASGVFLHALSYESIVQTARWCVPRCSSYC